MTTYLSIRAEPPPADVYDQCGCGEWSARGARRCRACGRRLSALSRYLVWYDALMRTYSAARYDVSLGATYADVLGRAHVVLAGEEPAEGLELPPVRV